VAVVVEAEVVLAVLVVQALLSFDIHRHTKLLRL
jgi:hypothetical protein